MAHMVNIQQVHCVYTVCLLLAAYYGTCKLPRRNIKPTLLTSYLFSQPQNYSTRYYYIVERVLRDYPFVVISKNINLCTYDFPR